MKAFFHPIVVWVFNLGGLGMLLVGIVDSSFLSVPLANDLLVIAQSAAHHSRVLYYAAMATLGSTLGCVSVDVISRKAEAGLTKNASQKGVNFVERQVREHAAWTTAVAAILPPPFPFTPFVAAAAGVGYPRKKLLTIIGSVRLIRFAGEGALAIHYGSGILALAQSAKVQNTVIALILLAIVGSAVSIFGWIKKAKRMGHEKVSTA